MWKSIVKGLGKALKWVRKNPDIVIGVASGIKEKVDAQTHKDGEQ